MNMKAIRIFIKDAADLIKELLVEVLSWPVILLTPFVKTAFSGAHFAVAFGVAVYLSNLALNLVF